MKMSEADVRRPPLTAAVTSRTAALGFQARLPLEAEEGEEWAPFTECHWSVAPTLIEIDMKRGDTLFSHTDSFLPQTDADSVC